jgi:hypothetical protein
MKYHCLVWESLIADNIAVIWHVTSSALGRVVMSCETPMLSPRVRTVNTVTVPRNRGLCQFPKTSSETLVSPLRNGTLPQMPYQDCWYSYLLRWWGCLCCIYLAGDQWTVLRGLDHSKWRVLDLVDQSNWRHVIQQNTTRLWEHLSRGSIVLCDIYEVVVSSDWSYSVKNVDTWISYV